MISKEFENRELIKKEIAEMFADLNKFVEEQDKEKCEEILEKLEIKL